MDWVSIILAVLRGVSGFVQSRLDAGKIDEGQMLQIAKASAEIMRKSEYAKNSMAEFNGMPADDVDKWLRNLGGPGGEPGSGDSK